MLETPDFQIGVRVPFARSMSKVLVIFHCIGAEPPAPGLRDVDAGSGTTLGAADFGGKGGILFFATL